jgi:hypothetical protein
VRERPDVIEKQQVEVPAATKTKVVAVICDVCKDRHHHADNYSNGVDWNEGYDKTETTVFIKELSGGQYGGGGDVRQYHICKKCFVGKLEPFLKSLGAEPTTYDFDW